MHLPQNARTFNSTIIDFILDIVKLIQLFDKDPKTEERKLPTKKKRTISSKVVLFRISKQDDQNDQ